MLSFIPYLSLLILISIVVNILSWRPQGSMRDQWNSILDTRNSRSFYNDEGAWSMGSLVMLGQWFVFFGLLLYTYADDDPFNHLANPNREIVWNVMQCILIPLVWYLFQWLMFHWWGYLFHQTEHIQILNRIYKSVHLLAGPFAMVLFLLQMIGWIAPESSIVLLLLIFIIAQIVFIFSGIKIFWSGFGTLCFIFLYLCAFKIAPLLIIWTQTNI